MNTELQSAAEYTYVQYRLQNIPMNLTVHQGLAQLILNECGQ